jgi:DNA-binding SARP family transcriptional activator
MEGVVGVEALRVRVLGPVRALRDGQEVRLGPPRQRAVLAVLALRAGQVVSRSDLVDAVWGEQPPASAENGIHTYVKGLRRALEPAREARAPGVLLASSRPGYVLTLQPGCLDTDEFDRHRERAARCHAAGDLTGERAALEAALDLWDGAALLGVPGPFAEAQRTRLAELRLTALEDRLEVLLAQGLHDGAVAELAGLTQEHPLRERLRGLHMVALCRAGRQAEAISAYHETRTLLADELGVDPGQQLQQLYQRILVADPVVADPVAAPRPAVTVPRQLPPDVTHFTGRSAEMAQLRALAERGATPVVVVGAVDGPAGVGKTAVVVHFGHSVAELFPDGQLYVDLRGFDPALPPLDPAQALGRFLRALGVDPAKVPRPLDELTALYRTQLADRRMLVVLDNARDADQVRPLLPGSPTCLTLVTSRNRLSGLVALDGARRLVVDELPPAEAQVLLCEVIGTERAASRPADVAELARLCGYLPLALRIAAANLADRPGRPVADLVAELAEGHRLASLEIPDDRQAAVRAAFDLSYRALEPEPRRLFRRLGLIPGPSFASGAAAALCLIEPHQAANLLRQLAAAHMIEIDAPGRYRMHDLLRIYAAARCELDDGTDRRGVLLGRLLDHFLYTAAAADRCLRPQRPPIPIGGPPDGVAVERFADREQALRWCDDERANLVAAVQLAAAEDFDRHAWALPCLLRNHFDLRKHWDDWVETHLLALDAARRLGDLVAESEVLIGLGVAHYDLQRFDSAITCYQRALVLCQRTGRRREEGNVLNNLANVHERLDRYADAMAFHEQALVIRRELGDSHGEGVSLTNLANIYQLCGRYDEAVAMYLGALEIRRQNEDKWGEAITLHGLCETYRQLGDPDRAIERGTAGLTIFREIGHQWGQASTLHNLGKALDANHRPQAARECWQEALAIFDDLGDITAGEVRALLEG